HPAGLGEGRELVGDLAPKARHGPPPPHGIGLDQPGGVLAEAPQVQIQRGHGTPSLAPGMLGVQIRGPMDDDLAVRAHPRRTTWMAAVIAAGTVAYVLYLAWAPGSPRTVTVVNDTIQ